MNFNLSSTLVLPLLLLTACTSHLTNSKEAHKGNNRTSTAELARLADVYDFDFSATQRWLNITFIAPPHTEVDNINLAYKADANCPGEVKGRIMTDQQPLEFLEETAAGRVYRKKIAVDAGGKCQWLIHNLDFGLKYSSIEHLKLGAGYNIGPGTQVTIKFYNEKGISYDKNGVIDYRPEFFVGYRDTEKSKATHHLGGIDYTGKFVDFLAPFREKVFNLNTDLITDEYNITYGPILVENKRAFYYFRKKTDAADKILKTTYYIDGKAVKESKRLPHYAPLERPELYFFGGIFDKDDQ